MLIKYPFVAIMDGILYNDAFKHTTGDVNNETWTHLLRDLKIFDEAENVIMVLRRRFVLGAAEWMAGKNGSLRNDKEVLTILTPNGNISGKQCL